MSSFAKSSNLLLALLLSGTVPDSSAASPTEGACEGAGIAIDRAFDGGAFAACSIGADGTVTFDIRPEIEPINPSPWYAARLTQASPVMRRVTLSYHGARHRYSPWLSVNGGAWQRLDVSAAAPDGSTIAIAIPAFAGSAVMAAQPIRPLADVQRQWASQQQAGRVALAGQFASRDGRPVPLFRHGPVDAAHIHFFAARQHPPETTGAAAFDAFAETLLAADPATRCPGHAFVFAPMINPDGLARGHWRTNAGRIDPNRDWGRFGEPETAGIGQWVIHASAGAKFVAVLDFHSTRRDALYSSKTASIAARQFADGVGKATGLAVIPTQAAEGNTLKSWAESRLTADAFTVELADAHSPARAAAIGEAVAQLYLEKLACPSAGELD